MGQAFIVCYYFQYTLAVAYSAAYSPFQFSTVLPINGVFTHYVA